MQRLDQTPGELDVAAHVEPGRGGVDHGLAPIERRPGGPGLGHPVEQRGGGGDATVRDLHGRAGDELILAGDAHAGADCAAHPGGHVDQRQRHLEGGLDVEDIGRQDAVLGVALLVAHRGDDRRYRFATPVGECVARRPSAAVEGFGLA